ncbi:DNA polymerase [Paenibacillus dendrobii]|nr:DNA polymerase [Paenibacillus dendrobii]
MSDMNEILNILNYAEKKLTKTRTKNNEKIKKIGKMSTKNQMSLNIEQICSIPDNYILINTPELLARLVKYYREYKMRYGANASVFLDTKTYGLNTWKDELVSISIGFISHQYFSIPMRPFLHPLSRDIPSLPFDVVADTLRPLLESESMLVMANAKFNVHALKNWANIDITFNIYWDTMIAAGLLNENMPKGMKEWYRNYVQPWLIEQGKLSYDDPNRPIDEYGIMFDTVSFDTIPHRSANYYACHDVYMTHLVFLYQKQVFENPSYNLSRVYKLFNEVEMPLIAVFASAERRGVELDSKFLKDVIGGILSEKLKNLKMDIYQILGGTISVTRTRTRSRHGIKFKEEYVVMEELNLNSSIQLSHKLYDEHQLLQPEMIFDNQLRKPKKSISKKVLIRNKNKHKVFSLILEYRGLSQLIHSFCYKLPEDIVDGRIHCTYNQLVRTGRVSCSNPNLQQIPSKFDLIRYAFRAPDGRLLVSADFSQQELRWLAIFTQEEILVDIFKQGLDIHSSVACKMHGLNYEMFEMIRLYKEESKEKTNQNIRRVLRYWKNTQDLINAITYHNEKEKTYIDSNFINADMIVELAAFFEALRQQSKSVVFGVFYGITERGLADQIESSKGEAKSLIDEFKTKLTKYRQWEIQTHQEVMEKGYIVTVLGRKRRFAEEIAKVEQKDSRGNPGSHWKIDKCKRQSCNAIIQGSSADQSKKAMVDLFYPTRADGSKCFDRGEWLRENYKSQLEKDDIHIVLQVHDELMFDVPANVSPAALKAISNTMANAIPNDVGVAFKTDIEISPYWGGSFSIEQIDLMNRGILDWKRIFEEEVKRKLAKFGIEYKVGVFADVEEADGNSEG